jgi:hypothetical protein
MATPASSETKSISRRPRSPRRSNAEIERRVRKATEEFATALQILEGAREKMTSIIGTAPEILTPPELPDEVEIERAAHQVVTSYGRIRRHLGEQIERAVERRYRSAEDILQYVVADAAFGDRRLERVRALIHQGASAQEVLRALTRDDSEPADDAKPAEDAAA